MVFKILEYFLFQGEMGPPCMVMTIRCPLTQESRIYMYGLGVGMSTVFKILGHFPFKGRQDHPIWS
jgi:hypothetical protein